MTKAADNLWIGTVYHLSQEKPLNRNSLLFESRENCVSTLNIMFSITDNQKFKFCETNITVIIAAQGQAIFITIGQVSNDIKKRQKYKSRRGSWDFLSLSIFLTICGTRQCGLCSSLIHFFIHKIITLVFFKKMFTPQITVTRRVPTNFLPDLCYRAL